MPEPTTAENRRAAEILSGDINRWLGAHSDWPAAYKVVGFASSIMERIPADKRAEFADLQRRVNADRAHTRTEADGLAREAMAAYISANPNANPEDLLAAIDSNMRIANGGPATQGRNPRDYPLDNDSDSTFAALASEATVLARQQIAREAAARPAVAVPVAPVAPVVPTLMRAIMDTRVSGLTYTEYNMNRYQGSTNWGAFYGEDQVMRLSNIGNDTMGTAISANIDRNLVVKARHSNTTVIAGLNDVARNIDHSYQIGYHGQRININSGDSGQVASDATLALTLTREDIESGRIRSVNINNGLTTITLNDGRSVQTENKVVFRYVSGHGSDTLYHQMTAEKMRDWIVQDRVRNPSTYETTVTPPAPVAPPVVQHHCAPPVYYSQPPVQYYAAPPVQYYSPPQYYGTPVYRHHCR